MAVLTGRRESAPAGTVLAAGGVVWRESPEGIEILIVHRPKYDDWTIPKGKLTGDETLEQAALREVEEETGLHCLLGHELASISYVDRKGRPKTVYYWTMVPLSGDFAPTDEVDEALWLTLPEARATLSYDRDRDVLRSLPG